MSSKTFPFSSSRQEGWTAAHEGCRSIYCFQVSLQACLLVGAGTLAAFISPSPARPATSLEEWCGENNTVKPAKHVKNYTSAGLSISLASLGRSHGAGFCVEPTSEHILDIRARDVHRVYRTHDKQITNVLAEPGTRYGTAVQG
jgi:hypothetical protein